MHTPRGSGSLDGDSARRERRFSARSGDSLEDYPSLLEEEDYGPVHKTGEAITGPPQSLRSLRLTSPDEKGQELIAHLHDEPFSERVNHNHLLPDQGPSPVSPLPADSPISSALFGLNPVIHSDAEDSPLRLPDPQTGPFSSARDVQSHTDELRVAFFHTLETVDPGVFALGASFDSVTGVVFNPDMILCGEENSPRYASPVGTQHVLEAPQTKRLVIPDIQSKSLEIPYVPRMVKLSLKRAAAGAPKPFKPLKPPHAPGKPVRLSSESPLRRSGKNYWDFKHVGGGALRSIATGKVRVSASSLRFGKLIATFGLCQEVWAGVSAC